MKAMSRKLNFSSLPNKEENLKHHGKKRPFTTGDCSWHYQPHETYNEELPTPYEMFKEYFTDPIIKLMAEKQTNMEFLGVVKACIRMPKKLEC